MSAILMPPETSPTSIRWTREDCEKLENDGLLDYRYELVEGIIYKMPQNVGHAKLIRLIFFLLGKIFGEEYIFSQTSIDVRPEDKPTNRPEPDAIILSKPADSFKADPRPEEIRLLVEASDSTLNYDLTTKAGLYARAGIVEYWVVSLPDRSLIVHRTPEDGVYKDIRAYYETEQVTSLAAPDNPIRVYQMLPVIASQNAE